MKENERMLRAQIKRSETEARRSDKQLKEILDNVGHTKSAPLVHTISELRRLRALVKQLRGDVGDRDAQLSALLSSHRQSLITELEIRSEEYLREISRLRFELEREVEDKLRRKGEAQTAIEASFEVISEVKTLKEQKRSLENRIEELKKSVETTRSKQFEPKTGASFENLLAESKRQIKQLKESLQASQRDVFRLRTHLEFYHLESPGVSSSRAVLALDGREATRGERPPSAIPSIDTQIKDAEEKVAKLRAKKRRNEEEKRHRRRLRAKEQREAFKARQVSLAAKKAREAEKRRLDAKERRRFDVEERRQRLENLKKEKDKWTRRTKRLGGSRRDRLEATRAKRWAEEQFRERQKLRRERNRAIHHEKIRKEIEDRRKSEAEKKTKATSPRRRRRFGRPRRSKTRRGWLRKNPNEKTNTRGGGEKKEEEEVAIEREESVDVLREEDEVSGNERSESDREDNHRLHEDESLYAEMPAVNKEVDSRARPDAGYEIYERDVPVANITRIGDDRIANNDNDDVDDALERHVHFNPEPQVEYFETKISRVREENANDKASISTTEEDETTDLSVMLASDTDDAGTLLDNNNNSEVNSGDRSNDRIEALNDIEVEHPTYGEDDDGGSGYDDDDFDDEGYGDDDFED
eukprot:g3617.t1